MRWRKNAKRKLIEAFGGGCGICGYNKCYEALEFHHLDPSQKETQWSKINGSIRGWEYIVYEMSKCVMLCSNCHKEVHAGIAYVVETTPRFNEALICEELKSKKFERPKVEKKADRYQGCDLITLYGEIGNYTTIGDMFGVSGAAIKRRIDFLQTGKY